MPRQADIRPAEPVDNFYPAFPSRRRLLPFHGAPDEAARSTAKRRNCLSRGPKRRGYFQRNRQIFFPPTQFQQAQATRERNPVFPSRHLQGFFWPLASCQFVFRIARIPIFAASEAPPVPPRF